MQEIIKHKFKDYNYAGGKYAVIVYISAQEDTSTTTMKTISALAVAFVTVSMIQAALILTNDQKDKLSEYHKACLEATGVEADIIKKPVEKGDFPEDPKFKDYLLCMSKKAGFQNEAGEVQEAVIVEKIGKAIKDEAKAKQLAEKCITKEGEPAEVAFKIVTCFYNSTTNHIILVH